MSCCFGSKESEIDEKEDSPVTQAKGHPSSQFSATTMVPPSMPANQPNNQNQETVSTDTNETNEVADNPARNFGFRELAMATKNFRRETLLGESKDGKVFKGTFSGTNQIVAVKQLDRHGTKANKEFLAEVMILCRLRHPNLVELIGYCADGDQRILVYEYMEKGSLKNHIHELPLEREPLDWITRMKIASGAAQALEYLHEQTNPPILYRNFTSTSILLDENLEPKLADYGLVRLEMDSCNNMQQRIVCNVSCAPEYEQNGDLTPKSDVYSFGVVLLELITGRKALDTTRPTDEQNLITWAQPYFREPKRFPEMADPHLKGSFPDKSLNQAVGVAAMCVQEDPSVRPMISDVVAALSFLTVPQPPQPQPQQQSDHVATSTNDPDVNNHSSCSSSSSMEDEEELEASSSDQNEDSEDYSCSDSEDEDEQCSVRVSTSKTAGYNEGKCGTSSSESLYNEDDYWEDENSHQEETSYRSKSKPKSIKRKATLGSDKKTSVSRNSSKGNNMNFKNHSSTSLRKQSMHRKPSKNTSSSRSSKNIKASLNSNSSRKTVDRKSSRNNQKIIDVSLSKKTHEDSRRTSNGNMQSISKRSKGENDLGKGKSSDSSFSSDDVESSRRVVSYEPSRKNAGHQSDSSTNKSEVEILDGGEGLNARLLEDTYVPI